MCIGNIYEAIAVYHQELHQSSPLSLSTISNDMMQLEELLERYGKDRFTEYCTMLLEDKGKN